MHHVPPGRKYGSNFVTEGYFKFRYRSTTRKTAEGLTKNGDFKVFVDGTLEHSDFDEHDADWHTIEIYVEKGYHEITFIYKAFMGEGTESQDIEEILYAEVSHFWAVGIEWHEDFCMPCIGGSSEPGSEECD